MGCLAQAWGPGGEDRCGGHVSGPGIGWTGKRTGRSSPFLLWPVGTLKESGRRKKIEATRSCWCIRDSEGPEKPSCPMASCACLNQRPTRCLEYLEGVYEKQQQQQH